MKKSAFGSLGSCLNDTFGLTLIHNLSKFTKSSLLLQISGSESKKFTFRFCSIREILSDLSIPPSEVYTRFCLLFFATKIGLHHHQLQIIDTLFVVRASLIFLLCCFRGGFGPFVHMLLVANVEAKTFCHRIDGWWEERIWCEIQNLCLLVQLMWWPAKRRRTKKNIRIHTSEVSESSSGGLAPGVTWYSIQWTNLISQFRFCTNYLIRLFGMDAKRTYYFPIYSQVKWKDTLS